MLLIVGPLPLIRWALMVGCPWCRRFSLFEGRQSVKDARGSGPTLLASDASEHAPKCRTDDPTTARKGRLFSQDLGKANCTFFALNTHSKPRGLGRKGKTCQTKTMALTRTSIRSPKTKLPVRIL